MRTITYIKHTEKPSQSKDFIFQFFLLFLKIKSNYSFLFPPSIPPCASSCLLFFRFRAFFSICRYIHMCVTCSVSILLHICIFKIYPLVGDKQICYPPLLRFWARTVLRSPFRNQPMGIGRGTKSAWGSWENGPWEAKSTSELCQL